MTSFLTDLKTCIEIGFWTKKYERRSAGMKILRLYHSALNMLAFLYLKICSWNKCQSHCFSSFFAGKALNSQNDIHTFFFIRTSIFICGSSVLSFFRSQHDKNKAFVLKIHYFTYFIYTNVLKISPKLRLDVLINCVLIKENVSML